MAKTYWGIVNKIIEESDIVIEVLDARFPKETRNIELEEKIEKAGKKIIFAINKTDLVSEQMRKKLERLFVGKRFALLTVKDHKGAQALRIEIKKAASANPVTVGVCGYPNTGKSSVINALKGAHVARTSSRSGFTTGVQKINVSKDVTLLDTPGVIQYKQEDESLLAVISAVSKEHIRDPEGVAMHIIRLMVDSNPDFFGAFYGVETDQKDELEILDDIALKTRKLRGMQGDTIAAAKRIISDWQEGRIRLK